MPKVKKSAYEKVQEWISSTNNQQNYEILKNNNEKIFCKVCGKLFICVRKSHFDQHLSSAIHTNDLKKPQRQTLLTAPTIVNVTNQQFCQDLCDALISANIPWNKLTSIKLKNFLQTYTGKTIPDESTLRKTYLPRCYSNVIQSIRHNIGNSDVWISVDESTDRCGRYIANFIVSKLTVDEPGVPYLLAAKELQKTNHLTIARFINDSLGILWPSGIQHSKVKLFISDGASYMLKAGSNLKIFYPEVQHLTCIAHGLNLVCEAIRNEYEDIDGLISNIKKVFLKAPLRVQHYKNTLVNVPLPPQPIITRWGTWIRAAIFYADHFDEIKQVVMHFCPNESKCIENAQKYLEKRDVKQDLFYIKTHFGGVVNIITKLETVGLPLANSLKLIHDVENNLQGAPGKVAKVALNKLKCVLEKNPSYKFICKIKKLLDGDTVDEEININWCNFKFAPITSCDVERSFSRMTNILTDRRMNFTVDNLEQYLVCNAYE